MLLFEVEKSTVNNFTSVSGLYYLPEFISVQEEISLLEYIDTQQWSNELKRRVQHYGYRYDYKSKRVDSSDYLGPLPLWLASISNRLVNEIFSKHPDQIIVNEYLPGQGIALHTDCKPCFGEVIASLSLGSMVMMDFFNPKTHEKYSLPLQERSLLILRDQARDEWQHGIAARMSDTINGSRQQRSRRVSLAFRTIR